MKIQFEEVDEKDLMRSQLNTLRYRQSIDAGRIGTLEGAIKGAILQLESNVECFEACDRIWLKEYDDKTRQVIANLKELIVEK